MYLYIVYPYYSFFCCENHAAAKILDIKMSHVICVSGREIAGSKDIKVIDISEYWKIAYQIVCTNLLCR